MLINCLYKNESIRLLEIRVFQKLSTQIDLNFALPQRTSFLEIPEPALVGYYNKRYVQVNVGGKDKNGNDKLIKFELTARSGDGPYIPCMPAILMAKKLATDEMKKTGAYPCMGFITKDEYLGALGDMDIDWSEHRSD